MVSLRPLSSAGAYKGAPPTLGLKEWKGIRLHSRLKSVAVGKCYCACATNEVSVTWGRAVCVAVAPASRLLKGCSDARGDGGNVVTPVYRPVGKPLRVERVTTCRSLDVCTYAARRFALTFCRRESTARPFQRGQDRPVNKYK